MLRSSQYRRNIQLYLLISIFLLTIALRTSVSQYNSMQAYRLTRTASLFFPTPGTLASTLQTTFSPGGTITWKEENGVPLSVEDVFSMNPRVISLGNTYQGATNERINISFLQLQYSSAIDATIRYFFMKPIIKSANNENGNTNQYTSEWREPLYQSDKAHQEKAACIDGSREACREWYSVYRYGQFIYRVYVFSPDKTVPPETVQAILTSFDETVSSQLSK